MNRFDQRDNYAIVERTQLDRRSYVLSRYITRALSICAAQLSTIERGSSIGLDDSNRTPITPRRECWNAYAALSAGTRERPR